LSGPSGVRLRGTTGRGRLTTQRIDLARRLWPQPLLLLAAVVVVLPALLGRTPTDQLPLVVGAAATLAACSVGAGLVGPALDARGRAWLGWALVVLSGIGLLGLVVTALPTGPEHGLALAAALAATVAPMSRAWMRLSVQAFVVGGMAVLLVRTGDDPATIVLWVFLLGFVVWLCGAFSRDLLAVRSSAQMARRSAQRRAELLAAVGDLSGRTSGEAATTVSSTLRSLGFSVAGVSLRHGEVVVPLVIEGPAGASGLRLDEGVVEEAITENRTIVLPDPSDAPPRAEPRGSIRSMVVVPIRERGEPVGVVVGGRHAAGRPPEDLIEIVDVMAAHLGGVLETEGRIVRQRELLTRMEALEDMRSRLLSEISEHVRDPLTVVRGIAQTLMSHGDSLSAEQRDRLLEGFQFQTRTLRETMDALLDFSRFQAEHPVVTVGLVPLGGLLFEALETAELHEAVTVTGDVDAVVRTDPELVARTVALIFAVGGVERVVVSTSNDAVAVRFEGLATGAASRSRLLLGLAQRLVLAVDGRWTTGSSWVEIRLPRRRLERTTALTSGVV
jgi:signal transduction histidine kinase